jgi:hypothetical protein
MMLKHGSGTSDVPRQTSESNGMLKTYVPTPEKRATDTPFMQNASASSQSLANPNGRLLSNPHGLKTLHM